MVQEQMNNILKHAGARRRMWISNCLTKSVFISITVNGKGYNPLVKTKGVGITNMINRVESYNGEVFIKSNPGDGCRIEVRIPI
jgi:signal transduction histidine kinase